MARFGVEISSKPTPEHSVIAVQPKNILGFMARPWLQVLGSKNMNSPWSCTKDCFTFSDFVEILHINPFSLGGMFWYFVDNRSLNISEYSEKKTFRNITGKMSQTPWHHVGPSPIYFSHCQTRHKMGVVSYKYWGAKSVQDFWWQAMI